MCVADGCCLMHRLPSALLFLPQASLPSAWMECGSANMVYPCMSQLANLTCKACNLQGTLPTTWWSSNLQQLVLPDNFISGGLFGPANATDPKARPSMLQVLDVSYNKLNQIPDQAFWAYVGGSLQRLQMQGNRFPIVLLSGAQVECVATEPWAMCRQGVYREHTWQCKQTPWTKAFT